MRSRPGRGIISVMQQGTVSLSLDAEEAIVLFELLSRWSNDGALLETEDLGEVVLLDGLLAKLENQLVAPFSPDYKQRLAAALAVLRQRGGAA